MVELGRIERPSAEYFTGRRKLYCVANIYPIDDAPDDYKDLLNKYWDEVAQHLEKLELAGKIKKIFCEMIYLEGDDAIDALTKLNEKASNTIKRKIEEGGTLLPLERRDIFGPYIDWANCLKVVLTREVFSKVYEFFSEISEKRLKHIMETIDSNLKENEAGLLIMKDEDRAKLQFPKDIDVFLVTPPSYDNIIRWFRDKLKDL